MGYECDMVELLDCSYNQHKENHFYHAGHLGFYPKDCCGCNTNCLVPVDKENDEVDLRPSAWGNMIANFAGYDETFAIGWSFKDFKEPPPPDQDKLLTWLQFKRLKALIGNRHKAPPERRVDPTPTEIELFILAFC